MSTVSPSIIEQAFALGQKAGRAAGSWAADGNTPVEHIRRVLAMSDAGDPEVFDFLPVEPNLSGEYAGGPTPSSLVADLLPDMQVMDGPEEFADALDELSTAWEAGVFDTFAATCEATLRAFLPDEEA